MAPSPHPSPTTRTLGSSGVGLERARVFTRRSPGGREGLRSCVRPLCAMTSGECRQREMARSWKRDASARSRSRSSGSAATTSAGASTPRPRRASSTRRSTPASTSSTPPTSTAAPSSEEYLGRALAGRRDEVVLATKFGMAVDEQRRGARPEYVRQRARGQPAPAGDRPHRPLPAPSARPRRCRSRTRSARWTSWSRAGKVREIGCSNFSAEQLREARGGGARGRGPLRQRAERVQPAAPRAGARGAGRVRAPGAGVHPLLPAGQRPAHRQVPARPAAPRGHAGSRTAGGSATCSRTRNLAAGRGAHRVRGGARPHPAGAGVLLAAGAPGGGLGDRRRDLARAGRANASAAGWRLTPAELAEVDAILARHA